MSAGGKGSSQRPPSITKKQFDENWDMIFNRQKSTDKELFDSAIMKDEYYDIDVINKFGD